MRLALALGLVAVTLAAAVYIHQRDSSTFTGTSGTTNNPFATNYDGAGHQRGRWEDPVAVLVAIGGVAVAFLIVGSAARERV